MAKKRCTLCAKVKDVNDFYMDRRTVTSKRLAVCKTCCNMKSSEYYKQNVARIQAKHAEYHKAHSEQTRNRKFKSTYGVTLEEYQHLLAIQKGGCATCGSTERLSVDHCHKSGKVRGVLCGKCNSALGFARDCTTTLAQLICYLEKSK